MELITSSNTSSTESSTTETPEKFKLSDYLMEHYIIIIIPSVILSILLIILFILLIRKIINRQRFSPKQLETYSSVNYDDESIDEELMNSDDLMYTSCRLLVGDAFEDNCELTNSEPEYDCMSVDVTINAAESSIVDWDRREKIADTSQELSQSLKTLPRKFWKR